MPAALPVRMIPLTQLRAAEWNARKTFDPVAQAEFIESVREAGILTPLLVRPFPESEWHGVGEQAAIRDGEIFEIVAGHRRYAAAGVLHLAWAPAIVHELSDEAARVLGLVDNLQREDVPPMEQAQSFAELLTRLGSIPAVAAQVKKEQSYVAQRLKLCTLTLCGQDALREGLIAIDHALLLARVGADEQDAALKWCLDHTAGSKKPVEKVMKEIIGRRNERARLLAEDPEEYGYYKNHTWEPQSVQRLKNHMAGESGTPLARAPWPLDENYLVADAPICEQCPQNTSANAPLFADLAVGEPTCTDGACFKEKTQAFVHIRLADAKRGIEAAADDKAAAPAPLRVSWKQTSAAPRPDKETGAPSPTQIFKDGQWQEAGGKKKCEHARIAVTVDWGDAGHRGSRPAEERRKPGELVQACVEPKCKVHPKAYARKAAGNRNPQVDEKAVAEQREGMRLAALAETRLRARLASEAIEKIKTLPIAQLRAIVLSELSGNCAYEKVVDAILPGAKKVCANAKIDSPEFARVVALASLNLDNVKVGDWWPADTHRAEFIKQLGVLGYDASKAWAKSANSAAQPSAVNSRKKKPAKKAAKKAAPKKAAKKGGRK